MPSKTRSSTLKDVAAYAGVSMKTVSNVVNDWPYITDETRRKVQDAIRTVGYRPNQMARSLVTGKTFTIGAVIPDISNPFFGMALRGCEDSLFEGDYSLFLCNTSEVIEREKYYLNLLLSRGVDAIILWGGRICCQDLENIVGSDVPLVTIDMEGDPVRTNHISISVDNQVGALAATRHLIGLGYQRIAHLAGPTERITAQRREIGYCQALEQAGLTFDPAMVRTAAPTIRGGFKIGLELLKKEKPEAVFCYNDLMAVGLVIAAKELDIKVPDQLAIVGFDDIAMAAMTDPPLTTVHIDQYGLGRLAGQMVLNLLSTKPVDYQPVLYPAQLRVRGTSSKISFSSEQNKAMLEDLISTFSADMADQ